MKSKDKPNVEKNKDKKIILWEVNSFPTIEIKSGKDHEEDV
jgi:hypothetical protein